jgi:hypothetical protein
MLAGDAKESLPALNGAQVSASLVILQSYAAGEIGADGAVALLTAAGVPAESAQNMIAKQEVKEQEESNGATKDEDEDAED